MHCRGLIMTQTSLEAYWLTHKHTVQLVTASGPPVSHRIKWMMIQQLTVTCVALVSPLSPLWATAPSSYLYNRLETLLPCRVKIPRPPLLLVCREIKFDKILFSRVLGAAIWHLQHQIRAGQTVHHPLLRSFGTGCHHPDRTAKNVKENQTSTIRTEQKLSRTGCQRLNG